MEKLLYSREEMLKINTETLKKRGINLSDIADIAYKHQLKFTKGIAYSDCLDSVEKILSLRDVFHHLQLGAEIDRLAEEKMLQGPIQDIIFRDLGLFGIDELIGLNIAGLYGVIGETNFGDIDVNKPGICKTLNEMGKNNKTCHTFLDDIVGAIAAAASTRVAQVMNENMANTDPRVKSFTIFDYYDKINS